MKSILVMLSQSPLAGQTLLESLSAVMVLATYGLRVQIVLTGDAIALLRIPAADFGGNKAPQAFKSATALVESFEFYDLFPLWVDRTQQKAHQSLLDTTETPYQLIDMNAELLGTFEGVLRW